MDREMRVEEATAAAEERGGGGSTVARQVARSAPRRARARVVQQGERGMRERERRASRQFDKEEIPSMRCGNSTQLNSLTPFPFPTPHPTPTGAQPIPTRNHEIPLLLQVRGRIRSLLLPSPPTPRPQQLVLLLRTLRTRDDLYQGPALRRARVCAGRAWIRATQRHVRGRRRGAQDRDALFEAQAPRAS